MSVVSLWLWLLALPVQTPYVRTHDQEVRLLPRRALEHSGPMAGGIEPVFPAACLTLPAGHHGETVPAQGTLDTIAFANPGMLIAPVGAHARVAFFSRVQNSLRNQGIFVHDGTTLTPIVMGSGAPGGAGSSSLLGDLTPIGGRFSGLFSGTHFAPAVNANGDVLFLADVMWGSSPRGLFLYRASTGTIAKVAKIGDVAPGGVLLATIGPGSLNANREVVFLGGTSPGAADVYRWSEGNLTRVAAVGDASPLGSPYVALGTERIAFVDGTTVPVGPLPDIDDAGNVVFHAETAAGRRGYVQRSAGGVPNWIVHDQLPAPIGGLFHQFPGAACWNAAGEIAFFADVRFGSGAISSGWFAGTPGSWRKGLVLGDPLGGGVVQGLALSRNPMTPLDAAGNLALWADVVRPDLTTREHLVVLAPDGGLTVIARRDDPAPLGGTLGALNAWPSIVRGRGSFDCATSANGILSAHFLFATCPITASASLRNGSGLNASCFEAPPPVLGAPWIPSVDASQHPGATLTAILGYAGPLAGAPTGFGELLVDPRSPRLFVSLAPANGVTRHATLIAPDAALAGIGVALQGAILGGHAELCNAVDVVLGF